MQDLHARLQRADIKLAIEIPAGFGRDLYAGRQPEVGIWLDGGMPFRAETSRGYVEAVHQESLQRLRDESSAAVSPLAQPARLETRFRYNQDVISVNAIGPGVMAFGLLVSIVTKTQIAAILGTMILTTLPTVQFSGLITPRSSLDGGAALMGVLFPAGYFLDIAVGTFTKALNVRDLWPQCLALLGFFLGFTGLSLVLLKKQEA